MKYNSTGEYTNAFHIKTDAEQDKLMKKAVMGQLNKLYDITSLFSGSCIDACSDALESVDLWGGETVANTSLSSPTGLIQRTFRSKIYNPVPNTRYKNIIGQNQGTDISHLLRDQAKREAEKKALFEHLNKKLEEKLQNAERDATRK